MWLSFLYALFLFIVIADYIFAIFAYLRVRNINTRLLRYTWALRRVTAGMMIDMDKRYRIVSKKCSTLSEDDIANLNRLSDRLRRHTGAVERLCQNIEICEEEVNK